MAQFERSLTKPILLDLPEKMVFLGGPRQCGKTTLAHGIIEKHWNNEQERYLNWDFDKDRVQILSGNLPSSSGLVVFDEIHKYTRWRNLLKGLYDKKRMEFQFLVTGSARLDLYRRGGDSLQGRYHFHRLHPLTFAELNDHTQGTLEQLFTLGGFPEPFFAGSQQKARRWSRQYQSRTLREEIPSLERVSDIALVELLAGKLPELVGSPISLNALREDLNVSQPTVARWMEILERLYLIFRLSPFGSPKLRAVRKEQKHYHFDWTLVSDPSFRFENLIACHMLKYCNFLEDSEGENIELRYFRDTDKREVDFVLMKDRKPWKFIECKMKDKNVSPHLRYLKAKFPTVDSFQVCYEDNVDFVTPDGIRVLSARRFLADFI
jgi:uncharacterized protein